MKSKVSKILIFALVAIMLFGTVYSSAYESYDTYTYSIDGEPLKSPAAYTPDFTTYDSETMGLLAGNFWRYDEEGNIALWNGAMTPEKAGDVFTSEGLEFTLNSDGTSYSVTGYTSDKSGVKLEIPATYSDLPVTAIADGVFSENSSIKMLFLNENLKSVGNQAFYRVSKMDRIYYAADEKDFKEISIASGNEVLNTSVFFYSESTKFGNAQLSIASDMVADYEGNLYIVDRGNKRIVVLNKHDYKVIGIINSYVDEYGREQTLMDPTGIYVTDPNKMVGSDPQLEIYVADADPNAQRIVVFNADYSYKRTIERPDTTFLDNDDFQLTALAVDIYGRIFAISQNCHQGVMVLSGDGVFTGFIGAQKVTADPLAQLWNDLFSSADQLEDDIKNYSTPYNNITVDDSGFVYVTVAFPVTESQSRKNQLEAIKSKNAAFSPVKKLNSTGVEIMSRNGFFDPGGEVVLSSAGASAADVSNIVDIAIGDEGTWTLLDSKRSRTYTYDSNGNLLFAFGDKGDQIGNGENYTAMTYQVIDGVYNLALLHKTGMGFAVTVYHPTEYYDKIISALHNENIHNHSATIDDWQNVLTSNNNFDLAYIGIGKALYNQEKHEEAMEMLSSAYETDYYAKAFAAKRKDILKFWLFPVIIALIVVLVFFFKFLGYAKKRNKATSLKVGKRTYAEEMLYVFHLIFHPFDGFWDLKHEKRGSVRAATTILGITVVAFFYQAIGQGYMFNPRGDYSTVFIQVIAVLVPVLLWVISNWCLTTLFDGEGSLRDIYIATCYSLAPLPFFVVISTILTNVFTVSEGSIATLLVSIAYVWVALLLFFGTAVTHDYSNGKNVITILGTIVAMAVIMFIAILFSSLVIKMVTFVIALFTEIFNLIA